MIYKEKSFYKENQQKNHSSKIRFFICQNYYKLISYQYLLIQFTYNKIKSHLIRQSTSLSQSMIFKLTYNNQTHLYNKSISISALINFTKKVFKGIPECFTFIYQSPKGQMTYIETDQDLIGLKYCCTAANDFIIKLTIMKASRYEQFDEFQQIQTLNIVKENLRKIEQDIFLDLDQQSKQEAIKQYLSKTYQTISKNIAQQEQKLVSNQIKIYLSNLYEVSAKSSAQEQMTFIETKPKSRKSVRFSPQKPKILEGFRSQRNINDLVNEKVMQMIPSIVEKIYNKMEQKMKDKCKKCISKQIEIQNLIDSQIKKRISISCSAFQQNPQQ